MDKANTPRSRYLRSTGKQRNTPSKDDGEVNTDQSIEDVKHSGRKTRRKVEVNQKTNGDTGDVDCKRPKYYTEMSDGNSLDGCESECSITSDKQRSSPKHSSQNCVSPTISRKSLRLRRSVTPGPDLESSPSRKLTRTTSETKLQSISKTPQRNKRSASESKDFYSPFKNNEHFSSNRNFRLNAIEEKFCDDNEGDGSSQDEISLSDLKRQSILQKTNGSGSAEVDNLSANLSETINREPCETDHKTDNTTVEDIIIKENETDHKSLTQILTSEGESGVPLQEPIISFGENEITQNPGEMKTCVKEDEITQNAVEEKTCVKEDEITQNSEEHMTRVKEDDIVKKTSTYDVDEQVGNCFPAVITSNEEDKINQQVNIDQIPEEQSEKLSDSDMNQSNGSLNNTPLAGSVNREYVEVVKQDEILEEANDKSEETPELVLSYNTSIDTTPSQTLNVDLSEGGPHTAKVSCKPDIVDIETVYENESDEFKTLRSSSCSPEPVPSDFSSIDKTQGQTVSVDLSEGEQHIAEASGNPEILDIETVSENEPEEFKTHQSNSSSPELVLYDTSSIDQTQGQTENVDPNKIEHTTEESCKPTIVDIESVPGNEPEELNTYQSISEPDEVPDIPNTEESIHLIESKCVIVATNNNLKSTAAQNDFIISISETTGEESDLLAQEEKESDSQNVSVSHSVNKPEYDRIVENESNSNEPIIENSCSEVCDKEVKDSVACGEHVEDSYGSDVQLELNKDEHYEVEELNTIDDVDGHPAERTHTTVGSEHHDGDSQAVLIEDSDNSQDNIEMEGNESRYYGSKCVDVESHSLQCDQPQNVDDSNENHYPIVIEYSDPLAFSQEQSNSMNNCDNDGKYYEMIGSDNSPPKSDEIIEQINLDDQNSNTSSKGGSEANSDIYKNMSDFGSNEEEKNEVLELDESETVHTGDSDSTNEEEDEENCEEEEEEDDQGEDDEGEVEEEEEEDEEEEKEETYTIDKTNDTIVENLPLSVQKNTQNEGKLSTEEETAMNNENQPNPDAPLTYDKALAILNKDRPRDKKIDDEEFFDMFTQELNRVSAEEADSDSDIAIVDEWVPENQPKPKPVIKTIKQLQALKQAQRAQALKSQQPATPQHFSGHFTSQPGPLQQQITQENVRPPNLQRSFIQGAIYNQYNQGMPQINSIGDQTIYNQFGPHNSTAPHNMQSPQMFHPHAPPHHAPPHHGLPHHAPPHHDNFPPGSHFGHPLGSAQDHPMHFAAHPGLRLRNVDTVGNTSTSGYAIPPPHVAHSELNQRESRENESVPRKDAESPVTLSEKNENQATGQTSASLEASETNTPILDLLNLDAEAIKKLKIMLGLDQTSIRKEVLPTGETSATIDKKTKLEEKPSLKCKKLRRKDRQFQEMFRDKLRKERKLKLFKEVLDGETVSIQNKEPYSDETTSSEPKLPALFNEELSSDKERLVTLEDGNVRITIDSRQTEPKQIRKRKHRKRRPKGKKPFPFALESSDDPHEVVNLVVRRKKPTSDARKRRASSSDSSDENVSSNMRKKLKETYESCSNETYESCSNEVVTVKQVKKKKKTKAGPTILQSNCGTFTVDSVKPIQSSDSEVTSSEAMDCPASVSSANVRELKKKMKSDLVSGKNKLSNIFSKDSFHHSKGKSKDGSPAKRKHKARMLRKLPAEVLEKLSREEGKCKRDNLSSSESDQPKNKRKRTKLRVKSAAAEESYIPLVSSAATQFALNRLDREGVLTAAERAAMLRNEQLYGSSVKRITSKELISMKRKQQMSQPKETVKVSKGKKK